MRTVGHRKSRAHMPCGKGFSKHYLVNHHVNAICKLLLSLCGLGWASPSHQVICSWISMNKIYISVWIPGPQWTQVLLSEKHSKHGKNTHRVQPSRDLCNFQRLLKPGNCKHPSKGATCLFLLMHHCMRTNDITAQMLCLQVQQEKSKLDETSLLSSGNMSRDLTLTFRGQKEHG